MSHEANLPNLFHLKYLTRISHQLYALTSNVAITKAS